MKKVSIIFFIITVCLILLGIVYKKTADQYTGVKVYSGAKIQERIEVIDSGVLGRDNYKINYFDKNSDKFFIISGITGLVSVVAYIIGKKGE